MRVAKEIGTLWAQSNGDSQFVGSSSGVYFLRTVQNAFSTATAKVGANLPSNEAGSDTSPQSQWPAESIFGNSARAEQSHTTQDTSDLGRDLNAAERVAQPSWTLQINKRRKIPNHNTASQLAKIYFQRWHSIVPFLHGPTFLQDLEALYTNDRTNVSSIRSTLCQDVILQCVCSTSILDAPELQAPEIQGNCVAEKLLPVLGLVALEDNMTSIQALLSAQLYFVATMSLRAASTTGGLVTRAIMKAGLHRCPFRYPDLSQTDREMRKRIFWSAYVLDRFLSQALGHPLGIQDSDVDVCSPGTSELHQPVYPSVVDLTGNAAEDTTMHLPSTHPGRTTYTQRARENATPQEGMHQNPDPHDNISRLSPSLTLSDQNRISERRRENQSTLTNYVKSSRLMGRALETFHKSIHVRSAPMHAILLLKADIHAWGNDAVYPWLNGRLTNDDRANATSSEDQKTSITANVFSTVSYHQLILSVNRPSLSLETGSAEFRSAIQTCLGAAISTVHVLRLYTDHENQIFWPGHLLAVWMSGLVMAFACRIEAYSASNAISYVANSNLSLYSFLLMR